MPQMNGPTLIFKEREKENNMNDTLKN